MAGGHTNINNVMHLDGLVKKITNKDYQDILATDSAITNRVQQLKALVDVVNGRFVEILEQEKTEDGHNLVSLLDVIADERDRQFDQVNNVASDAEVYFDERSEQWQCSNKGKEYKAWKDTLVNAAYEYESDRQMCDIHVKSGELVDGALKIEIDIPFKGKLPSQSPSD